MMSGVSSRARHVAPPTSDRLLPGRLDDLASRYAPAWPDGAGGAGGAAGRGLRLLRPFLALLVAATLVQSLLHVVDVTVFDLRVQRINADADLSLDGWMGTLTTGLTAWGALLLALLVPRARVALGVLAALTAYLSLDDMLSLHEAVAHALSHRQQYAHMGYDVWPLVYFPLMCGVGWLLLRTARSGDVRTGRLLVGGLACLAVAVGLEALAPALFAAGSGHGQPLYESEVVVEEALELLGWGSMAVAMSALALDVLLHGEGADRAAALVRSSVD